MYTGLYMYARLSLLIGVDYANVVPKCLFLFLVLAVLASAAFADPVVVHHQEGIAHGYLVLRTVEGKIVASGELIQTVKGDQVTSELVYHFKDGSLHDETTVFTQERSFRLLSDHLVQKGASFPHPIDIFIDATKNEVTIHTEDKGKEKNDTQHMDLPEDLANGMIQTVIKNIPPSTGETKLSMLAASSKPRLVKLSIKTVGERTFTAAGSSHKATDYNIHVEIGGVAGAVAPLVGKQPPDIHIWISTGPSPTIIQSEGPLYEGGPIWRTDLAPMHVATQDINSSAERSQKK